MQYRVWVRSVRRKATHTSIAVSRRVSKEKPSVHTYGGKNMGMLRKPESILDSQYVPVLHYAPPLSTDHWLERRRPARLDIVGRCGEFLQRRNWNVVLRLSHAIT